MRIFNIDKTLRSVQQDLNVGVKLAHLTGDEDMSVFALELNKGQSIPAHYHAKGIETYFILSGEGMASTGRMQNGLLTWTSEVHVESGDCFTIYPYEVHKFKNLSDQVLRIIATTPLSHIGSDRFFVEEMSV
ncbi:Cupin domain-containing protein [Pontibacter ummariensis]|uniref:Cupin domain-containing protein n=1 Tax=Pontibacter ummariensis TaxID=1610492 RepID=A0A239LL23_9BACT|nr:cupin domain-containing protein [Pontibacter ummariensis]PRY03143.1 Cupin domain-containing protein [Pontibacter ummariensis]SNT30513.1 Cupin domain-containing protein [Pontibacter ummariensis]